MDKSVGTLLRLWGVSNAHRSNPSPHPKNNVRRVYPEFFPSFDFVRDLQENFEKDALF